MNKPEENKVYALTGGTGQPCIANGNTWAESEVKDSLVSLKIHEPNETDKIISDEVALKMLKYRHAIGVLDENTLSKFMELCKTDKPKCHGCGVVVFPEDDNCCDRCLELSFNEE